MADKKTFAFAGDERVGYGVSRLLQAAGFEPESVADAEVVFTYCSTMPVLEDLYYDSEGLIKASSVGAVLVDLSPSTPNFALELDAVAQVNGRYTVDAPLVVKDMVSPEAFGAQENLGIVAGSSDDEVYRSVKPMLSAIASALMWMGKAGAGQKAKAGITLQCAASLVGAVEAQVVMTETFRDVDVQPEDAIDFMANLQLITPAQQALAQAIFDEEYDGPYTIEHVMGEAAAAFAGLEEEELILPQAESCYRLMELLALVGGIDFNPAALKLVFSDEETSKRYGLDWSAVEDDECGCGCEHDDDHECECGHDPHEEHDCCGHHHHG